MIRRSFRGLDASFSALLEATRRGVMVGLPWIFGALAITSCGNSEDTKASPASSDGGTEAAANDAGGDAPSLDAGGDAPVASGFTAEAGFSASGSFAHGQTITLASDASAFGARPHEVPWLWDVVSAQYLNGADLGAYGGLASGDPVTTDVWTNQNLYQGWDEPKHKFKYTTEGLRHARVSAEYGNFAASPTDPKPYSKLAYPKWPSAWGVQDNAQMYLSWWQRMNGATPGYPQDSSGNGGEDKPLRFGDTGEAGLGEFDITVAGLTANTVGFGNIKSWGSWPDPGAAWHRVEFFVDRVAGIADLWVDGKLRIGSSWTVHPSDGGEMEFRPKGSYLYVTPDDTDGTELDTATWKNVTVHFLGFDDGGVTQMFAPGRNVELSEIYLDVTRARVELSTADSWQHSPTAQRMSEVQGRILGWSPSSIQFELNQGGFDSLVGLWIWVVTDDGGAIRIGKITG
ncbi:MAG: hypothetical protein R3B13_00845 [Polyangiaceae bacterium]